MALFIAVIEWRNFLPENVKKFRTETGIEICNSSRNISPPGLISINSSSWEGDDSGSDVGH